MSLRKYQRAEGFSHLSKQEHEVVEDVLRKQGKSSLAGANDEERAQVSDALEDSNTRD